MMLKIHAFFHVWGPSILLMAVIFMFSSIPSSEMPSFDLFDFLVKKGGHFSGYALLALANLHALRQVQDRQNNRAYILAWVLAVAYSATDEFHQSFVPGRHPALTDVGIDASGAAAGLLLAGWWLRSRKQKSG
jgi:VanZ family protein